MKLRNFPDTAPKYGKIKRQKYIQNANIQLKEVPEKKERMKGRQYLEKYIAKNFQKVKKFLTLKIKGALNCQARLINTHKD